MYVELDVVSADIPPLLGMDVLDRESITPCTVSNRLIKRILISKKDTEEDDQYLDLWSVPLTRSRSQHLFARMDYHSSIYFTRTQLHRLHQQFYHPSAEKLYNLVKKSRPEDTTPETLTILKEISKECDSCQRISAAPQRFRVAIGSEHVQLNERILLDLMYIEGKPVLHIIDESTKFSAARFIPNKKVDTIWKTLIKCWVSIYTGMPNRMLVDRGSEFGNLFINLAAENNIKVDKTGIEAHSSLGICERYHGPIRNTFRKIKHQFPQTEDDLALSISVKAINDTLGPECFVTSSLVFGEFPQAFTVSEDRNPRPFNSERAKIANYARNQMEIIMANLRVRRAMTHAVPPSSSKLYDVGDKVLIWREKLISNRIGEWLGPYEVTNFDLSKKLVEVLVNGKRSQFNVSQVKHYYSQGDLSRLFFTELRGAFEHFQSPEPFFEILATEILGSNDERCNSKEMKRAKLKEIQNLIKRKTFKAILKEEIPADGNVLTGRFVLTIKSTVDGKIVFKARYVIGGHRDKFKHFIVHSLATIQPNSVRLLLTVSRIFGFDVWTGDVKQAYLQSISALDRDVFIKNPTEEFELPDNMALKLLKPLYGLCDSGDLWYETIDNHHKKDLGMISTKLDPALYYLIENDVLIGMIGTYVDDILRCGDNNFKQKAQSTHETFEMDKDEFLPTEFTGFEIKKNSYGEVVISQDHYLKNIFTLTSDASFSDFRSMRMKLSWLSNSRPDCAYNISQLAQTTEGYFTEEKEKCLKLINETVKYAKSYRLDITFPKLSLDSLRIVGYSDASFANNRDLSSQLGYIILLMDDSEQAAPIYFKSYKSRRVTRSPMAAEVIAFSDMFNVTAALSDDLGHILSKPIPVQLLTDSKCLFDVISKGPRTSEKRIMLDIAAAREGFKEKTISDIGLVRSEHNIADGFTKDMSQKNLRQLLINKSVNIKCEQWILRK